MDPVSSNASRSQRPLSLNIARTSLDGSCDPRKPSCRYCEKSRAYSIADPTATCLKPSTYAAAHFGPRSPVNGPAGPVSSADDRPHLLTSQRVEDGGQRGPAADAELLVHSLELVFHGPHREL